MNDDFKNKLISKIESELNRTDEEISLIDTNLSLLAKKRHHLVEMINEWREILAELKAF